MRLRTICTAEVFSGFFGTNADGYQPDCNEEIEIELGDDEVTMTEEGPYPDELVFCPACGISLEWPQKWEVVE